MFLEIFDKKFKESDKETFDRTIDTNPDKSFGNIIGLYKQMADKLLEQIQHLQQQELILYNELESESTSQPNVSEIDKIIDKIAHTATLRKTLYDKLASDLQQGKNNIQNLSKHIQDQVQSTKVIEKELKIARSKAEKHNHTKNNKLRMVELGTYEAERYRAHKNFIKILSLFLLGLVLTTILLRYNVIPSILGSTLIILIVVGAVIMSIYKLYDLSMRSNLKYNQYDWNFDRKQAESGYETVWQHDKKAFEKAKGEAKEFGKNVDKEITQNISS